MHSYRNTILQLSTPYTDPDPSNSPPQRFQNVHAWNSHGQHAHLGYSRQRSVAIRYEKEFTPYITWRTLQLHSRDATDHVTLFSFSPQNFQRSTIGNLSNSCASCYIRNWYRLRSTRNFALWNRTATEVSAHQQYRYQKHLLVICSSLHVVHAVSRSIVHWVSVNRRVGRYSFATRCMGLACDNRNWSNWSVTRRNWSSSNFQCSTIGNNRSFAAKILSPTMRDTSCIK